MRASPNTKEKPFGLWKRESRLLSPDQRAHTSLKLHDAAYFVVPHKLSSFVPVDPFGSRSKTFRRLFLDL